MTDQQFQEVRIKHLKKRLRELKLNIRQVENAIRRWNPYTRSLFDQLAVLKYEVTCATKELDAIDKD